MRLVWMFSIFFCFLGLGSLSLAQKKEVVCEDVCVRYEEKQDCRYFSDPRIPPVCTKVKVCVQWEKRCLEVQR
ncbi:MAG: hypothetical protein N2Z40_00335 [Caldimicrobium sp.]|nr:hypothetical protein [Caldimicrobium sp.]MCX7612660.1 hypothetical protein [Caldimicrobium sp.]MDW8182187.1 hypothetical protein [Caldimicrobium sp.]